MTLSSRSEEPEELTPPSIPMNNKRNMNQRNIETKKLTNSSTSIEGGVLNITVAQTSQVNYACFRK